MQAGSMQMVSIPMQLGFRLAPRINAAGRMGHALNAVELFTSANGERAQEIAAPNSMR